VKTPKGVDRTIGVIAETTIKELQRPNENAVQSFCTFFYDSIKNKPLRCKINGVSHCSSIAE
jgi:hypothetical protein